MATNKDDQFVRDYSKALADALREKEQQSPVAKPIDQRLEETYRALCFDEPHVDSDVDCFLLAQSLSSKDGWALSERLVEGIRQGTARYHLVGKNNKDEESASVATDTNTELLTLQAPITSSPAGFASCAVAAFLQVPLNCCLASSKAEVETWLGSYRGPDKRVDINERMNNLELENVNEALEKADRRRIKTIERSEDLNEKTDQILQKEQQEDDEVWADESDSSDFVYESDAIDWTEWEDPTFDAKRMSQPLCRKWEELRFSVGSLLHELSFAKLAPLSLDQWKKLHVSDSLTQLTLTLLAKQDGCQLMDDEGMRTLGTQPLHVLQDGILSGRKDLLPDFLLIVQSLIAVDGPSRSAGRETDIALASTVGLVSLSKFSLHAKSLKETRKIRKCILECCEDIAALIERANLSNHRLIWAVLPLLDIISNRNMGGSVIDASFYEGVSSPDAQCLLNSGLFRELLMFYSKTSDDTAAKALARKSLLQAIQLLCLESMHLLGKYAWRVPELSKIIHTDEFSSCHSLDYTIWNLMGVDLASTSMMLRMKNVKVVTVESCRTAYQLGLERLKIDVVTSIDKITQHRRRTVVSNAANTWKDPILDLQRFTEILQSCTSLSFIWKAEMTKEVLHAWLLPIQSALNSIPAIEAASEAQEESAVLKAKTDDEEKAGSPLQRPPVTYEEDLAIVRKSIKVLTLSLQANDIRGSLSSKTD